MLSVTSLVALATLMIGIIILVVGFILFQFNITKYHQKGRPIQQPNTIWIIMVLGIVLSLLGSIMLTISLHQHTKFTYVID